jgi:cellulose synthase/poly-beta-1,6-N-acetylglucosamine synthase-like glycosyltransferase
MSNPPLVSVLLTSYNREAFIAESIESVLAQTLTDFELVVSDDQSRDGTVAIAKGYARRDSRIRVSVNEQNLGDYGNRRRGASLARGRFLKYHDSDDVMYRHCLQTMVEPLAAEPRAAFALSASAYWPGGPCPMLLTPALAYEREFLGAGLFHLGPASAMFRIEVFRELGGFPVAGVASDYLFWLEACTRVNVLLVPGNLFYYRVHAGQEVSSAKSALQYAQSSGAVWTMLNSPSCPLAAEAREQAKRNFTYSQARGAFRHFKRRHFASAAAILRYSRMSVIDWLRYLRPPQRTSGAGTPPLHEVQV